MHEQFISEAIKPVSGTIEVRGMLRGEPGLPRRFVWRGEEYEVADVLQQWRETGPCTSGSPEQYVRKHWYRIRTAGGAEMKIYFERQARSRRQQKSRWWLYTIVDAAEA